MGYGDRFAPRSRALLKHSDLFPKISIMVMGEGSTVWQMLDLLDESEQAIDRERKGKRVSWAHIVEKEPQADEKTRPFRKSMARPSAPPQSAGYQYTYYPAPPERVCHNKYSQIEDRLSAAKKRKIGPRKTIYSGFYMLHINCKLTE